MKKNLLKSLLILLPLFSTSCSNKVSDAVQKAFGLISLNQQSSIVLVSNSTAEKQLACTSSNKVVISKGFPAGKTLYCREKSTIASELKLGEICSGGVTIRPLNIDTSVKECSQISICGVVPSSIQNTGKRSDGGTIDQLTYENLPWGCQASIEFSFDPDFSEGTSTDLSFYVQPPECPFCARLNKPTCDIATGRSDDYD